MCTRTQRQGAANPQGTQTKLPASAGGPPVEEWVSRGSTRWGHWQQQSRKVPLGVSPLGGHHQPCHRACRSQGWVTSGQTTTREGVRLHPSADNWMKALLRKALPSRARPSVSHDQSLPSGILHKPLSFLHQGANRRSKKWLLATVAERKTVLHKVNQDEKAKSCVPDDATR